MPRARTDGAPAFAIIPSIATFPEIAPRGSLACPFYRRNPAGHMGCAHRTFTQTRYLSTHIVEHHRLPFWCPVCGACFFNNAAQWDSHIYAMSCTAPVGHHVIPPEGVDLNQVAALKKRKPRGQDPVDTWVHFWRIVFPDNSPDRDKAFMAGPVEEVFNMFREYSNVHVKTHLDEVTASLPADGWEPERARRYLATASSSFLAQLNAANSGALPSFVPILAAAPAPAAEAHNDDELGRVQVHNYPLFCDPSQLSLDLHDPAGSQPLPDLE